MSISEHSQESAPIVIAAFDGWNDAGAAATAAVDLLAQAWGATIVDTFDPEDYHDFQVNRPITLIDEAGMRRLEWPDTTVSLSKTPSGRQVVFVQGVEPSLRWRSYCEETIHAAHTHGATTVLALGALLADTPHSRPIPVHMTSDDPQAQIQFGLNSSDYEGPSGIVGVLSAMALQRGLASISGWAAVPHYVAQPPSPKATLALLRAIEDFLGEPVPIGDLEEESRAWQRGVDDLAEQDPEILEYVQQLEEAKDTSELPEASGEAIAREFERFLRRRDDGS